MLRLLDTISWYSLSIPTAATRMWSSLKVGGNMVRELDGEPRSFIGVTLNKIGR